MGFFTVGLSDEAIRGARRRRTPRLGLVAEPGVSGALCRENHELREWTKRLLRSAANREQLFGAVQPVSARLHHGSCNFSRYRRLVQSQPGWPTGSVRGSTGNQALPLIMGNVQGLYTSSANRRTPRSLARRYRPTSRRRRVGTRGRQYLAMRPNTSFQRTACGRRRTQSSRQRAGETYGIGVVQRMRGSSGGFGSDLPEVWGQPPRCCNWQTGYHPMFGNDGRDVCGSGRR